MTDEEKRMRLVWAISRETMSSLVIDKMAQLAGIIPPTYDTSQDAGRPWTPEDAARVWDGIEQRINPDREQISAWGRRAPLGGE